MEAKARGYTTEPMFWGVSMIGNLQGNNPVAAARVLNYLASPEGYKLTAVGVEGTDYQGEGDNIELLPARTERGFPTEAGDTGAHPLASTIVSWVPSEWQEFSLLYGKDQAFKDWYKAMRQPGTVPSLMLLLAQARWGSRLFHAAQVKPFSLKKIARR